MENILENSNNLSLAIKDFIESCVNLAKEIAKIILELWHRIEPIVCSIMYQKLSRKRIMKLLMSSGVQRNEVNQIVSEIHIKNGKYTLLDYIKYRKNELEEIE